MHLPLPFAARALAPALLLGLTLGACMTGNSSIGELDEASSGQGSEGEASGSEGEASGSESSATSESSGDAPPLSCPPTSQCSVPLECGLGECGGIISRSDEDGCPREPCSGPGQCPAGSTCFLPTDWASCGYHTCFDDPMTGACICDFGLDCNSNGLCVPDDASVPPDTTGPTFCGQHADAGSCEGAAITPEIGACRWYQGWQMPAGALCDERLEIAQCLFVPAFYDGADMLTSCPSDQTLTPLVLDEDGLLTVLLVDPDEQPAMLETSPAQWLPCDIAGTEAECECGCP